MRDYSTCRAHLPHDHPKPYLDHNVKYRLTGMIDYNHVDFAGNEEANDPGVVRSVGPLIVEAIPFNFMKLPGRDFPVIHFSHDGVVGSFPTGIKIPAVGG